VFDQTDISVVLMDTSGSNHHTMRNWTHMKLREGYLVEVATLHFGKIAILCSCLGLQSHNTFGVGTLSHYLWLLYLGNNNNDDV